MTPTQAKAQKLLQELNFKNRNANDWDRSSTEERCTAKPEKAMYYMEELETRIARRAETLSTFYALLRESTKMADRFTGMYQGFRSTCIAKEVLNPTDEELDLMSVDEIITSGYAANWRNYLPNLSVQQAVCLALMVGCPHANLLIHLSSTPEIDDSKPQIIKLKKHAA